MASAAVTPQDAAAAAATTEAPTAATAPTPATATATATNDDGTTKASTSTTATTSGTAADAVQDGSNPDGSKPVMTVLLKNDEYLAVDKVMLKMYATALCYFLCRHLC